MSKRLVAIGLCVWLTALVAAAMARQGQSSQSTTGQQPVLSAGNTGAGSTDEQPGKPAKSGKPSVIEPFEIGDAPEALRDAESKIRDAESKIRKAEAKARDALKRAKRAGVEPANVGEQRVNQLIGQWKTAQNDSDRDKVQQELREALKEQFQARLGTHEKEIEQLEAKVKQLREQLELRRQKQDEIVEFRIQQLLREAQGLGWGTEPGLGLPTALPFLTPQSSLGNVRPPLPPPVAPQRTPTGTTTTTTEDRTSSER